MANRLGEKIKKLRKEKKLTLEGLAQQIGTRRGYIWELENRGVKKPSAQNLAKIAGVLGVTSEFLMDDSKSEMTSEVADSAFFRKFENLGESDKQKIREIVEMWSKK